MMRLLCILSLALLTACGAAPQEEDAGEESEPVDMCELLAFYELAQYSDDVDDEARSKYMLLSVAMKPLFSECQEAVSSDSSGALPAVELPITTLLENDEWYELDEVGCRAMVAAHGELLFFAGVTGDSLEGLALDIYFAGESQPVEMDQTVVTTAADSGIPMKIFTKRGRIFPLGLYTFDVHVDEKTLRLQWNRESKVHRAFLLECPGRAPRAADMPMIVHEGAMHLFAGDECTLLLDTVGENFNVQVSGDNNDEASVDVFLPGETAPIAFDGEVKDVLHGKTPFRRQWLEGEEFPTGAYNIVVTFEGVEYKFTWERTGAEYDNVHVVCVNREA